MRFSSRLRFGPALGQIAGFALVAAVNAAMIAITLRLPRSGIGTRALHHAFDAGQLLAFGVLSAGAILLWQRFLPAPRRGARELAIFLVGAALGSWMLRDDFHGFAGNLVGDRLSFLIVALGIGLCAAALVVATHVGRRLARGPFRLIGVGVAIAVAALNHRVVAHDYPGVHFFALWLSAVLAGTSLTTWEAPNRDSLRVIAGTALVSLWSLVLVPSNAVRLELFRTSGSAVAPWLARIQSGLTTRATAAVSPESARWFKSRDKAPEVPASSPRLFAENAIVLLLVVDAGRADLTDEKHDAQLPNLARLRKSAVDFTSARTAAPGTTLAVTSLLTSRYHAQIRWADQRGREYPHQDQSPRFPEILSAHGVVTVSLQGLPGLAMSQGILRGFDEEHILPGRAGHFAGATEMIPALVQRLERVDARKPLFAYQHYDDAHAPYDLGGKRESAFESYLGEVEGVDRQLGRLLDFLDSHSLTNRTTIILTADHGEAFGEHNKQFHATTLYEELLHVPLLVRIPGVAPRRIDVPVSLVDIAPTILDGYGLPTPGGFMGQSLVPLLRANKPLPLGRPLVAESDRGHRAMIFPDNVKIIADDKLHTVEVFDLGRDPGELENLADTQPDLTTQRRALIDVFFDAHRLRR